MVYNYQCSYPQQPQWQASQWQLQEQTWLQQQLLLQTLGTEPRMSVTQARCCAWKLALSKFSSETSKQKPTAQAAQVYEWQHEPPLVLCVDLLFWAIFGVEWNYAVT